MKFTDNELKQLKKDVVDGFGWWKRFTKDEQIKALLARLEAAEAVASYTEKYAPKVERLQALLKAWHKAAGAQ